MSINSRPPQRYVHISPQTYIGRYTTHAPLARERVITDLCIPQMGRLPLSQPADSHTSSRSRLGSCNSAHSWHCLPGNDIRSHGQRPQFPELPPTSLSDGSHKLHRALPVPLKNRNTNGAHRLETKTFQSCDHGTSREPGDSAKNTPLESNGHAKSRTSDGWWTPEHIL